jgi:exodeoxyribonuclease-3
MRTRARERNAGWRIDYHFVSDDLAPFVRNAEFMQKRKAPIIAPISLEIF